MKTKPITAIFLLGALLAFTPPASESQTAPQGRNATGAAWKFAVSGDSRNCGDVVMPGIANKVKKSGASFYWHLGDLRKMSDVDEDIQHQPERFNKPLTIPQYQAMAWDDFTRSQLDFFEDFPVYLSMGNHDLLPPDPRGEFVAKFASWLDRPNLREQRLRDDPTAITPRTYYHWIQNGIDFIVLNNSTSDFDADQLAWFEKVLQHDAADPAVLTIVAGMHEALPESISKGHSMNQTEAGVVSGDRVYADLLQAQNRDHKQVYVLASHSHYFMDGTFKTQYWREHGGVLPGWIIGTAGAIRYILPPEASAANAAKTNVYGFLLGTADSSGRIRFDFVQLNENEIPSAVKTRYTKPFVHWCFAENQGVNPEAH